MSRLLKNDYQNVLNSLKEKIRQSRYRAIQTVNAELLQIYWDIGSAILKQQKKEGWGTKIIEKLAFDLKLEFPDLQGVSVRNLKYMKAFVEVYQSFNRVGGGRFHPPAVLSHHRAYRSGTRRFVRIEMVNYQAYHRTQG